MKFPIVEGHQVFVEQWDAEHISSKPRPATDAEIEEALTRKYRRNGEPKGDCPHTVNYDEAGYMYDLQYCLACGGLVAAI